MQEGSEDQSNARVLKQTAALVVDYVKRYLATLAHNLHGLCSSLTLLEQMHTRSLSCRYCFSMKSHGCAAMAPSASAHSCRTIGFSLPSARRFCNIGGGSKEASSTLQTHPQLAHRRLMLHLSQYVRDLVSEESGSVVVAQSVGERHDRL